MPSIRTTVPVAGLLAGILAGVIAGAGHLHSQASTLVAHGFDGTTHGWSVSGDTGAVQPQLHAAGGHPDGYISHVDEALGETWYFSAPENVLRVLASAEHGALRYDLKQSADIVGNFEDDVVVVGPAGRISYRFPESPGTDWRTFTVSFTAGSGWRWNWNAPATQAQIRSVLTSATSLEIRGEYHTGPDEGALDNVVITNAPTTVTSRP
ncbi:laminin B domain-containing protein [Luteitalea sp. TBR-22]|uniref:laminin B domain-containing protein n=1 Tax=Luteitalea sp. TBR-22 TaxID=2802971 RepID=UPI001EF65C80|nr:laminin B domain-containing protein [Luteitalea sp. TBR-22]